MKVAFLDRDGVINIDNGYTHKIEGFTFVPGTFQALRRLQGLGFKILIVTNQAGIAKGFFTEEQYKHLTNYYLTVLAREGIEILDVFYCPHHLHSKVERYRRDCDSRKPRAGMFVRAANKYDIDLRESIMVGDKETDLIPARKIGIPRRFLVKTGDASGAECARRGLVTSIHDNLLQVSEMLAALE